MLRFLISITIVSASMLTMAAEQPRSLKILFLGDKGHHQPALRFAQLKPVMSERGIEIAYTDNAAQLNSENLAKYDGLLIYGNTLKIEPDQEKALLEFVSGGKGFIPVHCASAMFKNSPAYIELVGGEFKSHGTGVFETRVAAPEHPIMKGFNGFKTWDETYVHAKHNPDRTVLQLREEEPWSWARNAGKGRVFYTAYGHDQRCWGNPGFNNLMERGIRWACGDDNPKSSGIDDVIPEMSPRNSEVKPFEYVEAEVPFYNPAKKGSGPRGADGWNKMQKPIEPAESMKHYVLPKGLELQLFAAEPEITKPIAMAWDHKGRLWISETIDYPNNLQPEGEGNDRIKICEDTDGDGRADKFTIFAEKLSIPTSLTFANGGIIVHQAPVTLFLKDTNGDDKADERKVLLSGWGAGDTHAGPSNLRWGFDNWVWGIVGYSSFNGEVGGEKLRFGAGFYRFKPDGSKLEFLRSNNNNSWGLGFSEEGIVFGSTANGNPSVYLPIANRYYESVRGWSSSVLSTIAESSKFNPITEKVRQVDVHGGFTAAAGHALYTARAFPKEYWNRVAFVNEPTGHLAAVMKLRASGSDFSARNEWNLVASDDEWAAPIMSEVGPDGMVWVIDWYNYIVQHNPTPHGFKNGKGNAYETPLRDKRHGRIYRIVNKGAKPAPVLKLDPADAGGLVAALKSDNLFWRLTAQRLLVERGNADVVPALARLAQDQSLDEIGLNPGAIHALWTLHGLNTLNGANAEALTAALAALKHPSAGVRRNAVQVLPRNEASANAILAAGLLADKDALVRLAACLAMSEMPLSQSAGNAIAEALNEEANINDRWIPHSLTAAGAAHALPFIKAVAVAKIDKAEDRFFEIVSRVSEHYARGNPGDTVGEVVTTLPNATPRVLDAIVAGLAKGWPKDGKATLNSDMEKALVKLMVEAPPSAKGQLANLAARWGSTELEKYTAEISAALMSKIKDEKTGDEDRIAAAAQLIEFRRSDAAAASELFKLIGPRSSPEFSAGVLDAIARTEAAETGGVIVGGLAALTPAARQRAITVLLGRADWTQALLGGIDKGKIQLAELSLDQKQALSAHPDKAIASAAKKLIARGGGLPDADRQKVIDELSNEVLKKGDATKGKLVFQQNCTKCHVHSGEGTRIGPDLTGMAAHPKHELLTHIIDPSRSVEGNFRQYTLQTDDGRVFVGLLASESKTSVELLDSEGKTHAVQRENIKKLIASPQSLMPEGFERQVPKEALTDLLEFLTQHGKFLPLDIRKAATVVSTKNMFFDKPGNAEMLIFPDWAPKTVEGVPFTLVDPKGEKVPNAILLHGPGGDLPPRMPKSVALPCNVPARAIHLLSGVSGWGYTGGKASESVSMIVRLKYADGKNEDIELKDGVHFSDYIRVIDVPESKLAFKLRGQQLRYLSVKPSRTEVIKDIELIKGKDHTAPIVMAMTVETLE